jgi:hypothetical protein
MRNPIEEATTIISTATLPIAEAREIALTIGQAAHAMKGGSIVEYATGAIEVKYGGHTLAITPQVFVDGATECIDVASSYTPEALSGNRFLTSVFGFITQRTDRIVPNGDTPEAVHHNLEADTAVKVLATLVGKVPMFLRSI